MSKTTELTTTEALQAVAHERAPRHGGGLGFVNKRIVCADGFAISVQASSSHYANDSHNSDEAPYWREHGTQVVHPFTTFEVGHTSAEPEPEDVWGEYESGGVWAWVPREVVAQLLESHGGAVAWEDRD